MMSDQKTYCCFFCQEAFEYKQHHLDAPQFYPVRKIDAYHVDICRNCATDQLDGVDARHEYRLVQKLKRRGLPVPERNEDGLLPMPFAWSSIFARGQSNKQ